jgi:hypothetical protein
MKQLIVSTVTSLMMSSECWQQCCCWWWCEKLTFGLCCLLVWLLSRRMTAISRPVRILNGIYHPRLADEARPVSWRKHPLLYLAVSLSSLFLRALDNNTMNIWFNQPAVDTTATLMNRTYSSHVININLYPSVASHAICATVSRAKWLTAAVQYRHPVTWLVVRRPSEVTWPWSTRRRFVSFYHLTGDGYDVCDL